MSFAFFYSIIDPSIRFLQHQYPVLNYSFPHWTWLSYSIKCSISISAGCLFECRKRLLQEYISGHWEMHRCQRLEPSCADQQYVRYTSGLQYLLWSNLFVNCTYHHCCHLELYIQNFRWILYVLLNYIFGIFDWEGMSCFLKKNSQNFRCSSDENVWSIAGQLKVFLLNCAVYTAEFPSVLKIFVQYSACSCYVLFNCSCTCILRGWNAWQDVLASFPLSSCIA